MSHKSAKSFPCTQCDFEAQSARQLSRHKAVTHTQNALKCPLCPFVTAYQTNLLRHRKDVHGICGSKGNKSCKFCGFLSEDNETLIQHQIEFHQDILKTAQLKFAKELVSAGGNEEIAELTSNYDQIQEELQNSKQLNGSMKKLKTLKMKDVQQKIQDNLNHTTTPTPQSSQIALDQLQELLQYHLQQSQLQQSQANDDEDEDDEEEEEEEEEEDDEDEYDTSEWTAGFLDQSMNNSATFDTSFSSSMAFNALQNVKVEMGDATPNGGAQQDEQEPQEIEVNCSLSATGKARLPATKIRRQYSCDHCVGFKTINPRQFLYHRRDVHGLKIKIVECPFCVYACQYVQKLQRHLQLVHKMSQDQITEIVAIVTKRKKGNLKAFKPNDESSAIAMMDEEDGANNDESMMNQSQDDQEYDNSRQDQDYEEEEAEEETSQEHIYSNGHGLSEMSINIQQLEDKIKSDCSDGSPDDSVTLSASSQNGDRKDAIAAMFDRSALAALVPGQQIDELDDDYAFECLFCQIKFGDVFTAQKHFSKHHQGEDPKSFIQIAPRATENVQVVTSQKKVFENDKSLNSCTHCGYKTRWLSELERHVRVHSKEKPFKCNFCDFKSKWKGDLNRHLSRYHPDHTQYVEEQAANDSDSQTSKNQLPMTLPDSRLIQIQPATTATTLTQDNILKNILTQKKAQQIQFVAAVPLQGGVTAAIISSKPQSPQIDEEEDDDDENSRSNSVQSGEEQNLPNANGVVKMYKCSDCDFMCNTASRFHVHFVQHLKTKPFQCSICGHRSNWEWDVTKHIKMKAQRDPAHLTAQPVLIHDSGKRDYSKYDKFVVFVDQNQVETVSGDSKIDFRAKRFKTDDEDNQSDPGQILVQPKIQILMQQAQPVTSAEGISAFLQPEVCFTVDGEDNDDYLSPAQEMVRSAAKEMNCRPSLIKNVIVHRNSISQGRLIVCYVCGFRHQEEKITIAHMSDHQGSKPYACKYCLFDTNYRDIILTHMSDMHRSASKTDFDVRFRCLVDRDGGCRILSQQEVDELEECVIEAQANAKSNGTQKQKQSQAQQNGNNPQQQQQQQQQLQNVRQNEPNPFEAKETIKCKLCPFLTTNSKKMTIHCRFHNPTKGSIQCKYCPYFVNTQEKLLRHQNLHQTQLQVQTSTPIVKPKLKALLTCPVCPFKTPNQEMYEKHVKVHGNVSMNDDSSFDQKKPQQIPVVAVVTTDSSELEFANSESLGFSLNDETGDDQQTDAFHSCNDCPAFFVNENEYKIHCIFHSAKYPNVCPFCTYSCANKNQLGRHVRVHTGEYMNKKLNNQAPESGENINYLEIAANLMSSNKKPIVPSYRVIVPKRPFTPDQQQSRPELKIKFTTAQLGSGGADSATKPPRKRTKLEFPCKPVKVKLNSQMDGKQKIVFNNDDEVKNQEYVETKEYLSRIRLGIKNRCMYRCADCPAVFTKVNTLIYHTTLHKTNNEFACVECTYSSDLMHHLEAHQSLHGLKQSQSALGYNFSYNCHKCPAGFSKRARLEKHLTLHGAEFNWKCEQCDYSVRYAATLVKHRAIHLINPNFETKPTNSSIPEYEDNLIQAKLLCPEEEEEEEIIESPVVEAEDEIEGLIIPEEELEDELELDLPLILPEILEQSSQIEGDDEGFEGEDESQSFIVNQEELEMAEFRAALDGEDLEDDEIMDDDEIEDDDAML